MMPMTPAQERALAAMLGRPYRTLRLEWNAELAMLRIHTGVRPIQCYTLAAMTELQFCFDDVAAYPGIVRHLVMSSDIPSVFNFGGDLALFVLLARAGDVDSLKMYGRKCIDLIWWMETADSRGVHTIALLQGDALGGGLEAALSFHKIVAERDVQAGFPEVLFNLFPGMGAWNFTIRKAGFTVANDMILSGRLYAAEELQRRGLIDTVVDRGEGEAAMWQVVRAVDPRLRGTLAALRARRVAAPIAYADLERIVDDWAASAVQLTDRDLRLMERLARAQVRKIGGADEGAIEEIKRIELEMAWQSTRAVVDAGSPGSAPTAVQAG
jgi:DSF synthase